VQSLLQRKNNVYYIFLVCIFSLRYPACNAHAPYCHLWPVPLYNIFPHYLINGKIFAEKSPNTKCVFWFSVQLLSGTFLILRRTERDMIKNVYRSACKVPVIVVRFVMRPEFSRQIFEKCSDIKLHENPFGGSRVVPWGRTDRHHKGKSRFSQFGEIMWKNIL